MTPENRPTYTDFFVMQIMYTDKLRLFMDNEIDGKEMLLAEINFTNNVGRYMIDFGQDAELFYEVLCARCGERYALEQTEHESDHLRQSAKLALRYTIPLTGRLVILQLEEKSTFDGLDVLPMVMTNICDLLTVVEDDTMRSIYRELHLGVEKESDGDVLFSQAVQPITKRMTRGISPRVRGE